MLLLLKNNFKQQLLFVLTVLLIIGLLYSRALLSLSSVGLGLVGLFSFKELKKYKFIFIGVGLIVLPVIVSGLWSYNSISWWRSVEVKLSLLSIIVGFLAANFTELQIKKLVCVLTVVVVFSAMYSCYEYYINEQTILQNYLVAKVMPVLMDDDHIRYSWLIVLNIVLLVRLFIFSAESQIKKLKPEQIIASLTVLFLIAYLHFLAAKTGLLCLYVSLILVALYCIFKAHLLTGLLFIALIGSSFFLAYYSFPSLKNRIQYVAYDFGNYSKGIYTEGSSDGARILSLKAGIFITQQHLLKGVGFGDIQAEVIKWHNKNHASSKEYERFLPTNQWLIYSAGSGLLGVVCFSIGLILLLRPLHTKTIFSAILFFVLLLPLVTDDSFEGQYGVTVFGLFVGLGISAKRLKEFS